MPDTWTASTDPIPWHHWEDGWFFKRLHSGAVWIVKHENANERSPVIVEATISPAQWASIVAAVSQFGEMRGIYQAILAIHGEPTL